MTNSSSFAEYYQRGPYRDFAQEHRAGGTFDIQMIEVDQPAIEVTDPALPQFSFVTCRDNVLGHFETNFGDGWTQSRESRRFIGVQPAKTACEFRIPSVRLRNAYVTDSIR